MVHSIWPESNGGHEPLPGPNVVVARAGTPPEQLSPEAVKGILVNPIYTGVGPFPRLVEDAAWVRACAKRLSNNPSPRPLPETERGCKPWFSPPLRFGEGVGGRGF